MKKIILLSIDGGGIRGILPATILMRLEKLLQEKDNHSTLHIGDYVDFAAGTSTGGILACLYLAPNEKGTAKYSAKDALDLYVNHGGEIFSRTFMQKVTSVDGILHEKYSADAITDLLGQYLGKTTLAELIRPCLITAYEMAERRAVFFTSVDAVKGDMDNFFAKDVARSTSAAPTYFEPSHIKSFDGKVWSLLDGGVFANNPALCAYAEARKTDFPAVLKNPDKPRFPSAKNMLIVSLGTGSVKKEYHYKSFKSAGEIKWLEPIIDILMSGNSETVGYQLHQMYGTLEPPDNSDYYRLEPSLFEACSEMDIVTPENITNLQQAGLKFAHDNQDMLAELADKILANR
jgi:patatin-like phospholipase/acyl hydrolase